MGMCVQNIGKLFLFLVLIAFLCSCEPMDNIFLSTVTYKINVQINDVSLDDCSFVSSYDEVRPYFDVSVSNDLDVTGLVVFLRNPMGTIVSSKVNYTRDHESLNDSLQADEIIIPVNSLDDVLPNFPIPEDLPMGRYAIVFQVMSGREILQRTERPIFYLSRVNFTYKGINVYLPGIIESDQVIPKEAVPRETVVMLEADVDFDSVLDPYIVWYENRRKISEGKFSEGAGQLFWRVPEQSGFLSLRAEIFPVDINDLPGYQKRISVFIPSGSINVNLLSNNIYELMHWYVFEGNLRDLKMPGSAGRILQHSGNRFQWVGVNETYGAASGYENLLMLPKVSVFNNFDNNWQILFRMFPLIDGEVLSIPFDSGNVSMQLYIENHHLILSLVSSLKTVSQTVGIPYSFSEEDENQPIDRDFIVAGINFSVLSDLVSAQINIVGNFIDIRSIPITMQAENISNFQIILGLNKGNDLNDDSEAPVYPDVTAVWDEFALYYNPKIDTLTVDTALQPTDELTVLISTSDDS